MLSGNEKVGAAISEPCSRLIRSFSSKADRWTISRQRPLYFDWPIQDFQTCAVRRQLSSAALGSGWFPSGHRPLSTKAAFLPAPKVKSETISPACFVIGASEYSDIGGHLLSSGKNVAHWGEDSRRRADVSYLKRGWQPISNRTLPRITKTRRTI